MYEAIVRRAVKLLVEKYGGSFTWDDEVPNCVNERELKHAFETYADPETAAEVERSLIYADVMGG